VIGINVCEYVYTLTHTHTPLHTSTQDTCSFDVIVASVTPLYVIMYGTSSSFEARFATALERSLPGAIDNPYNFTAAVVGVVSVCACMCACVCVRERVCVYVDMCLCGGSM
jgi:hypothetical protein